MSKWDKLLMQICLLPKDLRFDELRKVLWIEAALEENIVIQEPDGLENYSGQFKLRIPRSLHKSLAEHSKREGISMNQYCVYLLSRNDAVITKDFTL